MGIAWLVVYATHHLGLDIIFEGCDEFLEFCPKKLGFGLHADSIVLMNFLHILWSIEGRSVSVPDTFKQMLGLFSRYYTFIYPPWNVICLDMFGLRWCIFVN